MSRLTAGVVLLAIATTAACDDDGTGVILETFFADPIAGDLEVPPVVTDASGFAVFGWDGTTMFYEIAIIDSIADVTAAHIHEGAPGENGGVLVTLFTGPAGGTTVPDSTYLVSNGSFTVPDAASGITIDELLDLMRAEDTYVNIHTVTNPGGEIRGEVEPVTP